MDINLDTATLIILVLFVVSEVLGSSEKFKSNSVFQLFKTIMEKLALDVVLKMNRKPVVPPIVEDDKLTTKKLAHSQNTETPHETKIVVRDEEKVVLVVEETNDKEKETKDESCQP